MQIYLFQVNKKVLGPKCLLGPRLNFIIVMGYVSELKQISVKRIWIFALEPFKQNEVSHFSTEDQTTNTGTFELRTKYSIVVVLFRTIRANYSKEIRPHQYQYAIVYFIFEILTNFSLI